MNCQSCPQAHLKEGVWCWASKCRLTLVKHKIFGFVLRKKMEGKEVANEENQ
jgi:hypothetical protein